MTTEVVPWEYHYLENDFASTLMQIETVVCFPRFTRLACWTRAFVAKAWNTSGYNCPEHLELYRVEKKRRGEERKCLVWVAGYLYCKEELLGVRKNWELLWFCGWKIGPLAVVRGKRGEKSASRHWRLRSRHTEILKEFFSKKISK